MAAERARSTRKSYHQSQQQALRESKVHQWMKLASYLNQAPACTARYSGLRDTRDQTAKSKLLSDKAGRFSSEEMD